MNMDRKIEIAQTIMNWLIVILVLMAGTLFLQRTVFAQGLAFTEQELACFDMVDAPDFIAPVVEPRFKIRRGLRGCTNFQCLQARARKSKKVLQVFIVDRLSPSLAKVHFGNLGWAKDNVALIPNESNYLTNALLIARGVESQNTDRREDLIERDLRDHDRFVAEVNCLRKTDRCKAIRKNGGKCEQSFNEVQPVRG